MRNRAKNIARVPITLVNGGSVVSAALSTAAPGESPFHAGSRPRDHSRQAAAIIAAEFRILLSGQWARLDANILLGASLL